MNEQRIIDKLESLYYESPARFRLACAVIDYLYYVAMVRETVRQKWEEVRAMFDDKPGGGAAA